jgi:hypothetical protein
MPRWLSSLPLLILSGSLLPAGSAPLITADAAHQLVTLSDGAGQLTLRLNCQTGCVLDQVVVRGREVAAPAGVYTGVQIGTNWFTSRSAPHAEVAVGKDTVTVNGIRFGPAGQEIQETWKFTSLPDRIVWKITRKYSGEITATDLAFPQWNFRNLATWTGGLLDNGGVIWNKYLDRPNATYGGHFGTVTFWNAATNDALRITPQLANGTFGAGRFSRQEDDGFSFNYAVSPESLQPKHGQSRFLGDRQDLWRSVTVSPSEVTAEFSLQALDYAQTYNRGTFVGLDGANVRELFNTVARYGVIDAKLVGGNGWRSGYICLHEPFFAQIAAALAAPDYTANVAAFLDNARDHAIEPDGRVKSRWTYGPFDAMPGTYDQNGFYEAQWGYLLDSQPDYVMNVVEQYYLTGDRTWLAGHKESCERALAYLTRREVGDTGLVAMLTDSHTQQRGSDWIDIIWASYENAFINAQLYAALNLWAEAETALGDTAKAQDYRAFAARLKASFNQPIATGGFWDPTNQWYVYWHDKDGSVHGNNLVTPVNFAAIAYGLCDDRTRGRAILARMEFEMQKEKLFYWPLSFFPYETAEGAGSNFPFPKYENGDIFLSWGELGVRAYAAYRPALALKYVKNTLACYAQDGLSYQRYLRQSQRGEGDDILAGNCMPVVGLYRDIYGIQPRPNRLYLEPHLTPELNGTRLQYELRGQRYEIDLSTEASGVTVGNCTLLDAQPFAVNATTSGLQYFPRTAPDWALVATPPANSHLVVAVESWPDDPTARRTWSETPSQKGATIAHVIRGLKPNTTYQFYVDGKILRPLQTDAQGQVTFDWKAKTADRHDLKLVLEH